MKMKKSKGMAMLEAGMKGQRYSPEKVGTKNPFAMKGEMKMKKKKKNWIAKATENKGGLHRALGVKAGKKLTGKQLSRGAKMGGKVAKEVALAKTLKGFHKSKKHEKREKHQKMACKRHKTMNCAKCE